MKAMYDAAGKIIIAAENEKTGEHEIVATLSLLEALAFNDTLARAIHSAYETRHKNSSAA